MPKAHPAYAGGGVGVHVLEAACPVLLDEQAHRGKDGRIFRSAGPAAGGQPVREAMFGAGHSLETVGQDSSLPCHLSCHGAEGEALGHTPHLPVGIGRAKATHQGIKRGAELFHQRGHLPDQVVQEGPSGMAVVLFRQFLEAVHYCTGRGEAVKIRQHGLVHRQAHEAHFLPASGLHAVFSQLVRKAQLAG